MDPTRMKLGRQFKLVRFGGASEDVHKETGCYWGLAELLQTEEHAQS